MSGTTANKPQELMSGCKTSGGKVALQGLQRGATFARRSCDNNVVVLLSTTTDRAEGEATEKFYAPANIASAKSLLWRKANDNALKLMPFVFSVNRRTKL